jgi:hypothetical protein
MNLFATDDEIKLRIQRFIDHFGEQLEQIEAISGLSSSTFRGALAVSLLDALSISASKTRQSNHTNRDRFVKFVDTFSDWPDGKRISLPHLVQLLRKNPSPAFEAVRRKSNEMLDSWIPMRGNVKFITEDPLLSDFKREWPKEQGLLKPLEGISLERLTHYNLFWAYRNTLIHELRPPGYGFDSGHYDYPHYHELTTVSAEKRHDPGILTIELVYPDTFILTLCRSALTNLHSYLMRNKLNPYNAYHFGTYWVAELN